MAPNHWYELAFWTGSPEDIRNLALGFAALVATLFGIPLAVVRTRAAHRSAKAATDQQVTTAYSSAIEQLGNSKDTEVRIGAIYALERVARENPSLHRPIMETLSAYLREASSRLIESIEHEQETDAVTDLVPLTADMQAAFTVIGRRNLSQEKPRRTAIQRILVMLWRVPFMRGLLMNPHSYLQRLRSRTIQPLWLLDLSNCYLVGLQATGSSLQNVDLQKSDFRCASLSGIDFSGSRLREANLSGAELYRCNLVDADLTVATIVNASLSIVDLKRAVLAGSHLDKTKVAGCDFRDADLKFVTFKDADVIESKFDNALMEGTIFKLADIEDITLSKTQKDSIRVVEIEHAAFIAEAKKHAGLSNLDFPFVPNKSSSTEET